MAQTIREHLAKGNGPGGTKIPSASEIARLHETAHEHCFIANSVRTEIVVTAGPEGS
jgi:organic hydroperoxide reductase OsmC/OhrA